MKPSIDVMKNVRVYSDKKKKAVVFEGSNILEISEFINCFFRDFLVEQGERFRKPPMVIKKDAVEVRYDEWFREDDSSKLLVMLAMKGVDVN